MESSPRVRSAPFTRNRWWEEVVNPDGTLCTGSGLARHYPAACASMATAWGISVEDAGQRAESIAQAAAVDLLFGGGLYSSGWGEVADRAIVGDVDGIDEVIARYRSLPRTVTFRRDAATTPARVPEPAPTPAAIEAVRRAEEAKAAARAAAIAAPANDRAYWAFAYLAACAAHAAVQRRAMPR